MNAIGLSGLIVKSKYLQQQLICIGLNQNKYNFTGVSIKISSIYFLKGEKNYQWQVFPSPAHVPTHRKRYHIINAFRVDRSCVI